jgi:hypothetical protein
MSAVPHTAAEFAATRKSAALGQNRMLVLARSNERTHEAIVFSVD